MKYTIIHINNRAKKQMDQNHKILNGFEHISDIAFFNGNSGNAWDIINHRKIKTEVWKPYDGRSFGPLKGEYGIWVSTLNVLDYIIENNIDKMLVLEDDIVLKKNAKNDIEKLISELPQNWDFLSLYYFNGHNQHDKNTDIGSKYIHKSINQPAGAQAIIYSNSGAKKIRKLVYRKGIEYTSDCFIFEQSRLGFVNGYSIIPNSVSILSHEYINIKSTIDPENTRNVLM